MRIVAKLLLSLLLLQSACERAEQEIILVPENFRGRIIVLFDQREGKPKRYMDGKRIYDIPPNGILKTQFSRNDGWIGATDFFRGDISDSNRIPSFDQQKSVSDITILGLMGPAGSQIKDIRSNERFEYIKVYIGTKLEIDSLSNKMETIDLAQLANQDN